MGMTNQRKKDPPESASNPNAGANSSESSQPEITLEQFDELKARAAKAEDYWERLLRATADLENSKKRAARERQEAIRYANESLLSKLIPVLDSLEMATAVTDTGDSITSDPLKAGVAMVLTQFKRVFADAGIEEVDATGRPFNPNLHEAVSQESSTEVPDGQVIRQLRKGYKLNDRLIRPATVVVARNAAD